MLHSRRIQDGPTATGRAAASPLRRDLGAILGDGMASSFMVGIGEIYIAAFALALGLRDVGTGLLASLPLLAGALLQLVSPFGVRRLGSHRRWVVLCVVLQAASLLPLAAGGVLRRLPMPLLFVSVTFYWGAGMAAGPAWNTWVGRLVPRRLHAGFWAHRARWAQVSQLSGILVGGALLHLLAPRHHDLECFALLFAAAALARAISARCLMHQSEPAQPPPTRLVSGLEFVRRFRAAADGRLLLFLLAAQSAVQIAGPYFTPYMLRRLQLPYSNYVALLAGFYLAKIAALPVCGRLARRCGPQRVLVLGAIGIVPLPALWLLSPALPVLLAVNVLSGVVWAAYELGLFLLLFETLREEERTSMLTIFNLANSLATWGGSLLGALLLSAAGPERGGYALVFAVSFAARGAALLVLRRVPVVSRLAARPAPSWRTASTAPTPAGLAASPAFAAAAMDGDAAHAPRRGPAPLQPVEP